MTQGPREDRAPLERWAVRARAGSTTRGAPAPQAAGVSRRRRRWPLVAVACLVAGVSASPAAGVPAADARTREPAVEMVELGLTAPVVRVEDITDSGVVVGVWEDGAEDRQSRPFRWEDGVLIEMADLGGRRSFVNAVHERGVAVGSSLTAQGELQAVLWQRDGSVVRLGTPGLTSTAIGIARDGTVVGRAQLGVSDPLRPVAWRDGVMTLLDDDPSRTALLVNDRGEVVGTGRDPATGAVHTVMWDGRRTSVFRAPAGLSTFPHAVNRRGEVLIDLRDEAVELHSTVVWRPGSEPRVLPVPAGFLTWMLTDRGEAVGTVYRDGDSSRPLHAGGVERDGSFTDLGTLGGATSYAVATNERGQVLGFATDTDEVLHAVLWDDGDVVDLGADGYDVGPADIAGPTVLNRHGQVAGSVAGPDFRQRLVMWIVTR